MARLAGPWQTRVSFSPGGGFAYRPGEVVVRRDDYDRAQSVLIELARQGGVVRDAYDEPAADDLVGTFVRFNSVPDALDAVTKLNQAGIYAQVNHVVFADDDGQGFQANPFYANPFYANPFYANPFYANPFYANPFYANPFYANPFYANPNPAADPGLQQTGRRPSSARPAVNRQPAEAEAHEVKIQPRIAILDTGYARKNPFEPPDGPQQVSGDRDDVPDRSEKKGYLDPVAGHGTFIAGIIERYAPGCSLTVDAVINPFGDGDELIIGKRLDELATNADPPHLVNLSFGGYSSSGMGVVAEAITKLHYGGSVVVASAGNDGISMPMYPAAIPHVVAVGALDHEEAPAPFTNYGPWVRACTLGVEVVSTFFANYDGEHPAQAGDNIDNFTGWAVWSGTSFAAPRVLAALAREMQDKGSTPHKAVKDLIDAPGLERIPLLGTIIR